MITKKPGSAPNRVEVTFTLPASLWATRVTLVGDFNNWRRDAHLLEHSLHNGWRITIDLERGRAYQYRYLLGDSEWCNDCNADGYATNPFGGYNSIVQT